MKLIGIDYSLTSPSVCIYDYSKKFSFKNCKFIYLTEIKKYDGIYNNIKGIYTQYKDKDFFRQYDKSERIFSFVTKDSIVGIEGYSYSSIGRVFNIAESTGILKYLLYKSKIPINIYTPSEIKKFATGNGRADKEMLNECFEKETRQSIKKMLMLSDKQWNPSSDIIDSYYICKLLKNQMDILWQKNNKKKKE